MKSAKWNILFIGAATIAMVLFIYLTNDMQSLKSILNKANFAWLFVAILCMIGYWFLETGVLYCTANSFKQKLSFFNAFRTTMVGQLFNNITPFSTGGQPIQAYYLTKAKFELGEATSILLMKFIVYQAALIVYTGLLLVFRLTFFVSNVSGVGYLAIIGFSVNFAVIIGLIAIGFFPKITLKLSVGTIKLLGKVRILKHPENHLEKVEAQINSFHSGFKMLMKDKSTLFKTIGFTILQLTAYFLIPFFICRAFQISSTYLLSIIAASAFVMMVSAFVPLPGASGGAEGSFYLFFGIFLMNPSLTTIAIVIWRLITFYFPIFVGMIFTRIGQTRIVNN